MTCDSILVHFGMAKTGSSSIRAAFAKHLKDPRFHFVQTGMTNAGLCLVAAFKDDPRRFHYFRRSGLDPAAIPALRADALRVLGAELAKADGKTAIISAEAVMNFSASECRGLRDYLLGFSDSVRAVAYVRRPKAYMESIFQQRVKAGTLQSLDPLSLLLDYRRTFEPIDEAFGRERVDLWLFEPKSFPQSDVVLDFCERLGIQYDPPGRTRANEALSRAALSLMFVYRKFRPSSTEGSAFKMENGLLVRDLRRLKGAKLRLHSSLVAHAIDAKGRGVEWMSRRLGVSMAEDLVADDAEAVRSEDDLLHVPSEATRWLASRLGPKYEDRWAERMAPELVAEWMDQLRRRLVT